MSDHYLFVLSFCTSVLAPISAPVSGLGFVPASFTVSVVSMPVFVLASVLSVYSVAHFFLDAPFWSRSNGQNGKKNAPNLGDCRYSSDEFSHPDSLRDSLNALISFVQAIVVGATW